MLPKPFFPGRQRVWALSAVDGEHAIEMVNLVLEEFRESTFGRQIVPDAVAALVADANGLVAAQTHHELRKRETVIPELEHLRTPPGVFGVDEFVADAVDPQEDDAHRGADLDGADAASETVSAAKLYKSVVKILENGDGEAGVDGRRDGAQQRIAELEDTPDGHTSS